MKLLSWLVTRLFYNSAQPRQALSETKCGQICGWTDHRPAFLMLSLWPEQRLRLIQHMTLLLNVIICSVIGICYDLSFLFLHHSSDNSFLYWTNFSLSFADTLRLNSASIALRRAWPYFSPTSSHGRHFFSCIILYTAFSFTIAQTILPLISVLVFLPGTLLGPCTGSPYIYIRQLLLYWFLNLNLLNSPLTSRLLRVFALLSSVHSLSLPLKPLMQPIVAKSVTVHLLHHGIFLFSFLRHTHLLFGMYSYDWIHTLILLSSSNSSFVELWPAPFSFRYYRTGWYQLTPSCLRLSWTAYSSVRFSRIGHILLYYSSVLLCSMEFYAYASPSISR